MVKVKYINLINHFQTLDWLLLELKNTKYKFIKLAKESKKKTQVQGYCYLATCTETAWKKYKKYYIKADDTGVYYIAIILNPTLKIQWFYDQWVQHKEKAA